MILSYLYYIRNIGHLQRVHCLFLRNVCTKEFNYLQNRKAKLFLVKGIVLLLLLTMKQATIGLFLIMKKILRNYPDIQNAKMKLRNTPIIEILLE